MKNAKLKPLYQLVICLLAFSYPQISVAQLYINEIVAINNTGQMDDFFDHDDWIEIYNAGGLMNLAGYYLSDNPNHLTKWKIPTESCYTGNTYILPNSHLIIWADKDTIINPCVQSGQGPTHANFSLSGDGETVLLVAPDGVTIIDQVSYPQMAPDISYGRSSDGASTWQFFNNVTFAAPNVELVQPAATLFINEVQSLNTQTFSDTYDEYDPWIEVYNPNNFQVNLAGYFITNTSDNLLYQIPNTNPYRTVIPAQGFGLLWCDGQIMQESNHTSFTLSSTGGTVKLTAPDGITLVDSYTYPAQAADVSWGRSSDGNPNSIVFNIPTPTVTNTLIIIPSPGLFINEVLTVNHNDTVDNYNEHEDWFEIYNPHNFDINLQGYYFSDNPENPKKWKVPSTYPDSVKVPAGGWLLFWADEDGVQGVRHASFRLNNNSETLRFYTPDGFTLIDKISWQNMRPDTSLGRITDGSPNWWNFTGTTPEYSNNQGTLSIQNLPASSVQFSIWPNPAGQLVSMNTTAYVVVYTLAGREVLRTGPVNRFEVDHLSPGIYLVTTVDGGRAKLVIE